MSEEISATDNRAAPLPLTFRRCLSSDLPTCGKLAEDAWPARSEMASKVAEFAGMEGYMEYGMSLSNWTEVALETDRIVGFLFGRIDGLRDAPKPASNLLGELPWFARSIFGSGRNTPILVRFILSLALTESKARLNIPPSDASIEMFIVGSAQRGRGVGTRLLERFLETAKRAGSGLVTVYTDDTMSNWQFYERKGFVRRATFYDNITSFYAQRPCHGIVYSLGLTGQAKTVDASGNPG